ncbi:hypothetical protein OIU74_002563 [Salix koriyanagi]|uniref:Uncharacterized protein n=1 Tax=Salix koriyanagi TaxID=2511006 RepID=A0A9Q0X4U7_9ROSI|nr:hypothetical protein OIU74_002563 [Salix koriyanagi]
MSGYPHQPAGYGYGQPPSQQSQPYGSAQPYSSPYGAPPQPSAPYGSAQPSAPYGSAQTAAPYGSAQTAAPYGSAQHTAPYGSAQPYGSPLRSSPSRHQATKGQTPGFRTLAAILLLPTEAAPSLLSCPPPSLQAPIPASSPAFKSPIWTVAG